jgi:large subunit ribosomal protein L32
MGVPKRRTSKSRKNMRRSHHAARLPTIVNCPRCKTKVELHTICPECGFYRGKPILEVEAEV